MLYIYTHLFHKTSRAFEVFSRFKLIGSNCHIRDAAALCEYLWLLESEAEKTFV